MSIYTLPFSCTLCYLIRVDKGADAKSSQPYPLSSLSKPETGAEQRDSQQSVTAHLTKPVHSAIVCAYNWIRVTLPSRWLSCRYRSNRESFNWFIQTTEYMIVSLSLVHSNIFLLLNHISKKPSTHTKVKSWHTRCLKKIKIIVPKY